MKIIAFHLPQFHTIPENDLWWGKGFTEWVNVRKAKPLFKGHYQPRVPLNKNYYNLLDDNVLKWQVELAKKYGIYGFCFYHYWFNGKLLLEEPIERFRDNPEINHPYCLCWANESWTNAWVADKAPKVLMPQKYGEKKEWEEHFNYLLPYFKDPNYIKEDGKPLFVIYRPEIIDCLNDMLDYWQELAVKSGLIGIVFAYQQLPFYLKEDKDDSRFKYNIEYQPAYSLHDLKVKNSNIIQLTMYKLRTNIREFLYKFENTFKIDLRNRINKKELKRVDYDKAWNAILNRRPTNEKSIPGAFVDWDNTPRRKERGLVIEGANPKKFQHYLTKQIINARDNYKKDMIFLFAWNEWAEGGYLEPDEKFKFGYLEAIYNALKETGELEK